jgi:hypothetical protein
MAEYDKGGPASVARDELRASIRELVDRADREGKSAKGSAARWRLTHLALGLPTAALAAMAGFTGLTSATGRVPAGRGDFAEAITRPRARYSEPSAPTS